MNKLQHNRVLLAMSGGLDSSVSAILLKQAGYHVTGITFRPYDSVSLSCLEKETGCCNADTLFEAAQTAKKLGIEHHIVDVRDEFKSTVINNFIEEYLQGRTPNPCVLCNKTIKWGVVMRYADKLGCQYMATGHYARIMNSNGRFCLSKAADEAKDQSYFLWMLGQEELKRTLFPLGDLTKTEVRSIARENGFVKIADKRESQEVCFIPDNNYRRFLEDEAAQLPGEGNYTDMDGNVIGRHKGYPFYTIGQRKGLNIALGEPAYVVKIDAENNIVVLGKRHDLKTGNAVLEKVNITCSLADDTRIMVKIRYRTPAIAARLSNNNNSYMLHFADMATAVTPGQSAVFYLNNIVIGGGVISKIV